MTIYTKAYRPKANRRLWRLAEDRSCEQCAYVHEAFQNCFCECHGFSPPKFGVQHDEC